MRRVPEEATVVFPSAVLPQVVEADPRLQKGMFVVISCKYKTHDHFQLFLMCLPIVGAAGVRSSQWPGLST